MTFGAHVIEISLCLNDWFEGWTRSCRHVSHSGGKEDRRQTLYTIRVYSGLSSHTISIHVYFVPLLVQVDTYFNICTPYPLCLKSGCGCFLARRGMESLSSGCNRHPFVCSWTASSSLPFDSLHFLKGGRDSEGNRAGKEWFVTYCSYLRTTTPYHTGTEHFIGYRLG